jgi:cyclic pyranopterin phosphate synthase
MAFEEAARLVGIFSRMGFDRVRFTGGEPLVRRDIVKLVDLVRTTTDVSRLVMTTNANRLAELAPSLARAGLRGVNVSLDSLDPARFAQLTRGGKLSRVLAGIDAALEYGIEVKINAVIMGTVNQPDAPALVDYAWERGITPRFIELMPLGAASDLPAEDFVSHRDLIQRLRPRLVESSAFEPVAGQGPARYLDASDGSGRKVGFITAVSDEFCGTCNRVRVTARGDLRACLASPTGVSIRDLMRQGESDEAIAWAIHGALGSKRDGHFFNDAQEDGHRQVGMSLVGG